MSLWSPFIWHTKQFVNFEYHWLWFNTFFMYSYRHPVYSWLSVSFSHLSFIVCIGMVWYPTTLFTRLLYTPLYLFFFCQFQHISLIFLYFYLTWCVSRSWSECECKIVRKCWSDREVLVDLALVIFLTTRNRKSY